MKAPAVILHSLAAALLLVGLLLACGGGGGGSDNGGGSTLTAPTFTTQPADRTIVAGSSASFTVAASGNPSPTFTWERSSDGGSTWATVGGATSATYAFTAQLTDNTARFRAQATNSVDTAISNAATLTVNKASGTFVAAGDMSIERGYHSATLLPDGKVLLVGGLGYGLDYPDRYDPATSLFTTVSGSTVIRSSLTATSLPDGKVLIAGGSANGTFVNDAEVYDPSTGTFSATGTMAQVRSGHTATLLNNGKVLITGGYGTVNFNNTTLSSVELYDPASGTFTATGSLSVARSGHTATLLANGKVLIAGGGTDYTSLPSSAELYDPETGLFSPTGSLVSARVAPTATLLTDGRILLTGGYNHVAGLILASAEIYDPSSGQFTAAGNMNSMREWHTATLLSDGTVLIVGGCADYVNPGVWLATAEIYDPVSGNFTSTGSLNQARQCHTATLLPNGQVLIAGGMGISSAELYQ